MMIERILAGALLALLLPLAPAPAQESGALRLHPAEWHFRGREDRQGFRAVLALADGTHRDVTAEVEVRVEGEGQVALDGPGFLLPRHDGEGRLIVRLGERTASGRFSVRGAGALRPRTFQLDVVPILTRFGCNSGGCHGAATGKNGFKLSLFGYDPASDHLRLTREMRGRRLARHDPERSLMLQKPAMKVPHKGGRALPPDDPHYRDLVRWIEAGAAFDADAPELESLRVVPARLVLAPGRETAFRVQARYSDGSLRDVTSLAHLDSSDAVTFELDPDTGCGQAKARGEAIVMARFGVLAEVARVVVVDPSVPFAWPEGVSDDHPVDRFVHRRLRDLRLPPGPVCDDATFVRRVHLDLLGLLPERAETEAFVADPDPRKRARLVERLLRRPEFAATWTLQLAEVLEIDSDRIERKPAHALTTRIREHVARGGGMDDLAYELLTASGSTHAEPAAAFWRTANDPKEMAEGVAQVFLGVRLQCAQCHDHPFERWTMDDYYGFTSFFTQVASKRGADPLERIVYDRRRGEARHPVGNRVVPPRYLGGAEAAVLPGQDRREAMARWLVDGENPWFARNLANRVWARLFGRGLVDPVDDMRTTNPASHPELLDHLARELVAADFDIRALFRSICTSRTYQIAAGGADLPSTAYAQATPRRLSAEQLLDAIGAVTGVPTRYPDLPSGARASELVDGDGGPAFLEIFGRPARASNCACERKGEPTLGQALHLVNGDTIARKIADGKGRLARALARKAPPSAILEDLWLRAYSRPPRAEESKRFLDELAQAEDARAFWQDLYWAVLNSPEFLFNH